MSQNKSRDDEANKLLQEGIHSYPDALVALAAFRQEVYKRCVAAVSNKLGTLSEAIGTELTKDHMQLYMWNTDTEACVCCKVQSSEMIKIQFYGGVDWWEGDDGVPCVHVDAGFWVPRRLQEPLKKTIKGAWEKRQLLLWEDEGVYIAHEIDLADSKSFEDTLGDLIEIWVVAGKKCGGFQKYLAQTPEA